MFRRASVLPRNHDFEFACPFGVSHGIFFRLQTPTPSPIQSGFSGGRVETVWRAALGGVWRSCASGRRRHQFVTHLLGFVGHRFQGA